MWTFNNSLLEVAIRTVIVYAVVLATSEDVGIAVLEVDGSISVLKKDDLLPVVCPHHRIRFLIRNN